MQFFDQWTSLAIVVVLLAACDAAVHRTLDEARAARQQLVQKHLKRLKKADGAVKLVGGAGDYEGNVEILHLGKWGAVCDDEWDAREAEVVCRQLGFGGGFERVTHSSTFGPAKRRYWMDNVVCDGHESELGACRFDGWATSDCDTAEAAGVVCRPSGTSAHRNSTAPAPATQPARIAPQNRDAMLVKRPLHHHHLHRHRHGAAPQFRLAGGRVASEGRVEVRFNGATGHWGTVCADGWSLLEANVLCRSLGLGFANEALHTDFFNAAADADAVDTFGAGGARTAKMLLSGTECHGNETSLLHCRHHGAGVACPGSHRGSGGSGAVVAAVMCVEALADLVVQHRVLEESAHLEDRPLYWLQCAMEENCLASAAYAVQRDNPNWRHETRRLLKFTASVLNAGTADFRPSIPKHQWEWHMCHMHYHSMEVFAVFNVFDEHGAKVAEGHKASFCLEDNQCEPGVERRYACANYGDQGISVNCYDIYKYNIDCQWVDISDLAPGVYTLQISTNPEFKVPEQSYDNNSARCRLLYTETYARVSDCRLERHS